MCGIHCRISKHTVRPLDASAKDWLCKRGPDVFHEHEIKCGIWHASFASSVLSLRGRDLQSQPVIDENSGSVLCWNGEAWYIDGQHVVQNDTIQIASDLFRLSQQDGDIDQNLTEYLNQIQGPFAFIFYDAVRERLSYGRDRLGRRSLLFSQTTDNDELTISSVEFATPQTAREVNSNAIFIIDLKHPSIHMRTLDQPNPFTINKSSPYTHTTIASMPGNDTIRSLITELQKAVDVRVRDIPTYTALGQSHSPSKVAILFSGGLDCTLLALLVHESLPADQPVDLLNVAFENPRVINARNNSAGSVEDSPDTFELCPDRITGRSSFSELSQICPERGWRFVAINIPFKEFQDHKSDIIRLMFPHNTEMDLSITAALYFASRGQGQLSSLRDPSSEPQPYTTAARVLLSGLGADELFGGYARHAAAFGRGGFSELINELELDITRIGHRNLGRDDRVIAHWSRETRYPFLDEQFVKFTLALPAWEKCGFRHDKPIPKHFEVSVQPAEMSDLLPDKMLLRCAMWQMGMKKAAAEKKRAIQFGARTAKMFAGRTKGTDKINELSAKLQ